MFRTRACVGICLLLIGYVLPILAQQTVAADNAIVPPMVKFNGALTDANGKSLTDVVGVTFLLYKDSQGGAPLWMETQNVQPDKTGHYTVMLGSNSSRGLPPDLFASGEARWLGVQVQGQAEQSRTVLLSVPYALKAADAETIGGLPPSAFVLAAPGTRGAAVDSTNGSLATFSTIGQSPAASNVTTSGGTVNALPLWTTKTNIQSSAITQSGSGKTAKVGINTAKPATTLDVSGAATVRGNLSLPATGTATKQAGKNSQPTTFTASSYNSTVGTAVPQNFRWQAEPMGNNTANASGSLNLLFGAGSNSINETGLNIASNGLITFAPGQTFPGAGSGTVTSVGLSAPASDFTVSGSPVTQSGTLGLSWAVSPTSANAANAIVKRDGTGSFAAGNISVVTLTAANPAGIAIMGSTSAPAGAIAGINSGSSAVADGVDGVTNSAAASGVAGINNSGGIGIYGTGGTGVYGAGAVSGVEGQGGAAYSNAGYFLGWSAPAGSGYNGSLGIEVFGGNGDPTVGSGGAIALYGQGGVGPGGDGYGGYFIGGSSTAYGHGIVANAGSGYAGYFNGDVNVTGNLSKGGGSFKIDHPLDPANKYLYHSFVESPDMMNIYNGTVALDANGEAVIPMPEWFGVLNRDFRYQLTCIGGFAPVYIAEELVNNQFKIGGGRAGLKVSWQITGIRQDAWANAHRIPVEEEKNARERGFYIHPELYGAPAEKQIEWAHHPEMMKRMKERRTPQHPASRSIAQPQTIRASN